MLLNCLLEQCIIFVATTFCHSNELWYFAPELLGSFAKIAAVCEKKVRIFIFRTMFRSPYLLRSSGVLQEDSPGLLDEITTSMFKENMKRSLLGDISPLNADGACISSTLHKN
jgi:hypothetical protein